MGDIRLTNDHGIIHICADVQNGEWIRMGVKHKNIPEKYRVRR